MVVPKSKAIVKLANSRWLRANLSLMLMGEFVGDGEQVLTSPLLTSPQTAVYISTIVKGSSMTLHDCHRSQYRYR
eukprot:m.32295 g.32295  ORF g.32295 m.32295 type:complete len:75 (-) comp12143_c0_seq1:13-237(-)